MTCPSKTHFCVASFDCVGAMGAYQSSCSSPFQAEWCIARKATASAILVDPVDLPLGDFDTIL